MNMPNDTIRLLIPLMFRRMDGSQKILQLPDCRHSEDQIKDTHILCAIGRVWA